MEQNPTIQRTITKETSAPDKSIIHIFKSRIKANNGVNIYVVMLLSFALKFPFCFLFGSMLDITRYTHVGNYINLGLNPYLDHETWPIFFWNKYPALFFELYGAWFFLFGNSVLSMRIFFLIGELLTTYVLYLIGKQIRTEKIGVVFAFLFSFIPTNFIGFINGDNDSTPLLFLSLAILYFFKEKYIYSAIFLGLGVCFKIFPIFFLLCLVIYFFKKGDYQKIALYIGILSLIFLITSIRFLISTPREYLESIFIHTSRANTGYPTSQYVPFLYDTQYQIDSPISISISMNFIIQIIVLGTFCCFFLMSNSHKPPQQMEVIFWALIIYISLPFLMQRGHFSNWVWISPFAIIFLFNKDIDLIESKHTIMRMMLAYYIFVWIALLVHNTSIPYNVFQSYTNMEKIEEYIVFETFNERAFRTIDIFKFLIYLPWVIIFLKVKPGGRYFIGSFIVNLLDWGFYYFEFHYWLEPSWWLIFKLYYLFRVITIILLLAYIILVGISKRTVKIRAI